VLVVCLDLSATILLYRLFGKMGLYTAIILDVMLCNLQGPKLTTVFGLTTSLGMILYAGIYFATDLLSERYGKREATRAVFIGFAVNVLVVVMMSVNLLFQPTTAGGPTTDLATRAHEALTFLFGFTPRLVFGSMVAYLVSQTHDVWLFHLLKDLTRDRHLWLRNNLSTIVSQAIDTAIYSAIVWWSIFDLRTAVELAGAKYLFKVIIALMDTPFIYWARTWDVSARDWGSR
jgi:hypothetical protein